MRDQNQTGLTEQQLNRIAMLGPDGVKMVSLLFCTQAVMAYVKKNMGCNKRAEEVQQNVTAYMLPVCFIH